MGSEWPTVRLGDLVEVKHGWPFKSQLFSEELTGRPIVVSIGNFNYTGGFRFDSTTRKEYRGDYPEQYVLQPREILLVMTCQTSGGEILGVPARVPSDGFSYLHNQRLGRVVPERPDLVDDDYLYWMFLNPDFNRYLATTATGSKILHTSPSRIEDFVFQLPPLAEQRAIASILGALDDKIELNCQMSRTLDEMAQATFKSWFVDFERSAERVAASGLPPGWAERPLDSIAVFRNGLAMQKHPPGDGLDSVPVIKISQLRSGDTGGADQAGVSFPPGYLVQDGDLLFSWSGSLVVDFWTGGRGALNQHLFKVEPAEGVPSWFVCYWIREHLASLQRIAAGKATTMGHIQRGHLTAASINWPTHAELESSDADMRPLVMREIGLRLQSMILAEVRDSLLPKLVSGNVEVVGSRVGIEERG